MAIIEFVGGPRDGERSEVPDAQAVIQHLRPTFYKLDEPIRWPGPAYRGSYVRRDGAMHWVGQDFG